MGKKTDKGKKWNIKINDENPAETAEPSVEESPKEEPRVEESELEEKPDEEIIEEYKNKVQELEDRHLRLAAEFENYKKRMARQFEDIIKSSGEKIIIPILEVIDNFERALEAVTNGTDFTALHEGMELTYQQLYEILKKEGVEPIKAVGETFDPNLHEAMMQVESDEYPDGVIAEEISRGYKLNGRVIRFSKVAVSAQKSDKEEDKKDESEQA